MRLVAFLASSLLFGVAPGAGSAPPGGIQDPSPQERVAKAISLDLLDRLIPAAEAELARDGADPTDVRALARRLGSPAAAFQWVRDHIAFEPYEGVLRGAAGALAAGAANSWDQALLLQELLAAIGQPSRIVQVPLDDAQCSALVDAFLQAAPRPQPVVDQAKVLADVARVTGIAAARLQDLVGRQRATAEATSVEIQQLAAAHAGMLRAALRDRAVDGTAMRAAAIGGVRLHAFVQLASRIDGELRYRDLDPTPLGAADGDHPAAAAEPVSELPRHSLRFQLRYKTTASESTILDVSSDVADALRQPLGFQVAPADPDLPSLAQFLTAEPEAMRARWQKIKLWQAILRTGTVEHPSRVFDLAGGLHDVAGDGRIRAAGDIGAGVARGFDAFGGGDAPRPAFRELSLVATVRAPDGSQREFTRTLLDAAGCARGERPNLMWRMLALGGPIGGDVVARAGLAADLGIWRGLRALVGGDAGQAVAALDDAGRAAESAAPVELMRLELQRERMTMELAAQFGVRRWMPLPQLLVVERRVPMCDTVGDCVVVRFDWMASDIRFLAAAGSGAAAAFEAALAQGAADTIIEARALEFALPMAPVRSAAHGLERARAAGRPLNPRPVAGGRLALEVAGESSWYEIDPVFGCAVGRLPGGLGGAEISVPPQALNEWLKANRPAIWFYICLAVVVKKANMDNILGTLGKGAGCFLGAWLRFVAVYPAANMGGISQLLGLMGDLLSGGISFFG